MKYELTNESIKHCGRDLYRIRSLEDLPSHGVKKGDLGGFLESEANLSQSGQSWIASEAKVFGGAQVSGDAKVSGNTQVFGRAQVYGNSYVYGNAQVYGQSWVYGNAYVYGNAKVGGEAQVYGSATVCGEARVSGKARVFGDAWVSDFAEVFGEARVSGKVQNSLYTKECGYDIDSPLPEGRQYSKGIGESLLAVDSVATAKVRANEEESVVTDPLHDLDELSSLISKKIQVLEQAQLSVKRLQLARNELLVQIEQLGGIEKLRTYL